MNTLRNRIALLLICAIVSVVGLATFAADRVLSPPPRELTSDPLARQIMLQVSLFTQNPAAAQAYGLVVQDKPIDTNVDERGTRFISRALAANGKDWPLIVSHADTPRTDNVSVKLGEDRWIILQIPQMGPPEGAARVLALWVCLIVLGSAVISLFAAAKITKPLRLLEGAVTRIGPDGVLPLIPETGSGEVRATAKAINRLSTRLKTAMESRMRLVAAAGHDLRTPMTRMRLRAEFVADEAERAKWLADLEELDSIADSAIRLVREEVDSNGATEILQLDRLVTELVAELRAIGYSAELQPVKTAQPLVVQANPIALTRALRNLMINAATHGHHAVVSSVEKNGEAVVLIEDNGPGIPEELIGRIFEPFFRVDAGRRKMHPGAGLGLAIAKEIIERMGGRIDIANKTPNGIAQTVTLPVATKSLSKQGL
ncbi:MULTISPECIES: ATP-binding protein [Brucella/Ochrobactrum group]|uniref:histidine kinase n=2 Tax=Ochrobactrum TaxID=528 RepID=A0A2P9HGH9_9HYPH|nr:MULTISPECIES: ATP-binding protein [Brucella]MCI1001249.1 HAMP domain-containing protein [Ochrobactrum sp. C6C9]WHT43260.1 ATP-binding protein [Ochrobactrum sp. SSR]NNU59655.1 HAMP domain-containing protein [[Ochrobactrum] soli]WHS33157.1 ATP-binding protein [Brucella sp. NM4]SPL63179.1 Sensor histidine kinase [[Ochrobactrum] soli]